MKRKFYFIAALALAAIICGGSYAYAFTLASATTGVTPATGDIATVDEAVTQPDWQSILDDLASENKTMGEVPTGDLFDVTPNVAYSGDLDVKLYLANTDNLTKAYSYLNMKVYLEDSVSANETPNYQLLTLDNGNAGFTLLNLAPLSDTWTQTTQADFESGNLTQLDTTTSPGDVLLDIFSDNVSDNFTDETKIAYSANLTVSDGQVKLIAGGASGNETFRPNAAGDDTNISYQYPDSGAHWDKVDDVTADDWSTYVYSHGTTAAAWYNTDWLYRKKITINSANVSADLTDFPVLISLASDTDLAADAQDDGDDILFTSSNGTSKLSHEIEEFDDATGELASWVKVPSLSASANTTLYMYYGNATVGDQQDAENVWDINHIGVWHLSETSGTYYDSTTNDNDSTAEAPNSRDNDGIAGNAPYFTASSEYINFPDTINDGEFTVELWFKPDWNGNDSADHAFLDLTLDPLYFFLAKNSANNLNFYFESADDSDVQINYDISTVVTAGNWYYMVGVGEFSSSGPHLMYLDGSQVGSSNITVNNKGTLASSMRLGSPGDTYFVPQGPADAVIDEVRVSNIVRTDAWIETGFNNLDSPSDFYSVGSEETDSVLYERDLYNIPDHVTGSGAVDNVTAYFRFAKTPVGNVAVYRDTNNTQTSPATTGTWEGVEFNNPDREDSATYEQQANDIDVKLKQTGRYLVIYAVRATSTSDSRHVIRTRVTLAGSVVEGSYGYSYSRHDENDELYATGCTIINNTIADQLVRVEWENEGIAGSDVLSQSKSSLALIKLPDAVAYGRYTDDTDTSADGGTTWNDIPWSDIEEETDTAVIERQTGNTAIQLKKVTKYLVKYSVTYAQTSGTRTQRIGRATLAGTAIEQSFSYAYFRNASTEPCTLVSCFIVNNTVADQDVVIQVQRGDADVDGGLSRVIDSSGLEIMELPASAETVITHDNTGGQDVSTTQTLNWARNEDQRDAASFTLPAITTIEVEQADDYLFLGNGLINDTVHTSSTRLTSAADWFIGGVEHDGGGHGTYIRHDQATSDTWMGSFNAFAILPSMSANDQITLRTALEGQAGGTDTTTANQSGFCALRIGSLAPGNVYARTAIKTHGTVYTGSEESTDNATFVTKSYQWTTNPDTGQAWTWDEIDALQVGIELRVDSADTSAACTQVYLVVNYTAYYPTGTLISINLLSAETVASIDSFYHDASAIPSGTGLKVQFSTDNTTWYNSAGTEGGWDTLSEGTDTLDLSGLGWSGPNFYYHMLFTSDGSDTPVLDEISVIFSTYYTWGTLISSAHDAGDGIITWDWLKIYFTIAEPSATDISFQLRTAATEGGLSTATWYGPTSPTDNYTISDTEINPVHDGDRWIQYKAYFIGPGDSTPTLSDVSITYTAAAMVYTIEVIGGGYCLVSDNTSEWSVGWTVTPEFYCEASQRR